MKTTNSILLLVTAVTAVAACAAQGATTIYTTDNDANVRNDGNVNQNQTTSTLGRHGTGLAYFSNAVFAFLLPDEGASFNFTSADFSFNYISKDNITTQNVDLYGLDRIAATDTALAADYFSGPSDSNNTRLQFNILSSASATGVISTNATGDSNLVDFLNLQYAGGTNAGKYTFLRLSLDEDIDNSLAIRYVVTLLADAEAPSGTTAQITYTAIPEPSSAALLGLFAAFALLYRRR